MDQNLVDVVKNYCFLQWMTLSEGIGNFAKKYLHDKMDSIISDFEVQKNRIQESVKNTLRN